MSRANAALESRENKVSSRGNQRIVRSFINLILLIVTHVVHFTVHAIKVNGPTLMEKIKKRQ